MRYYLTGLLLFLGLLPTGGHAQPIEPSRGDKVIELTTSLSDTAMFRTIGRILVEEGYTYKADKTGFIFQTAEKPLPESPAFHYSVTIVINQKKIRLTGLLYNTVKFIRRRKPKVDKGIPIDFRTGKNDMRGPAFNQLDELAHSFTTPLITSITAYSRR
ncbi:hypothetical protein GO755_40695 [Spirosoma sp. HMF4905]|uniref:DUF4468 domain-containing protein n=1 Tax=Spirosoma arboris TaxID=2682092 RepID=A0A7K1SRE5_9BACT|nr:hypothetical protein [Spirosoma arboris]MVM36385.1 hypothetical protein [Spirosoma arboris]